MYICISCLCFFLQKCKASQRFNAYSQSTAELQVIEIPAIEKRFEHHNNIYRLRIASFFFLEQTNTLLCS